jgi:nicotinamidase-related amidase
MPHPRVLDRTQSVLVVIDVQEAYRDLTVEHERMVRGVRRLLQASQLVGVPILVTEQYPKGLGHLLPEVAECLPAGVEVIEKRSLSCCGALGFSERLAEFGRRQVLVCGLETHACVNQTVHDLLAGGYQAHVAYDATSSRFELDYRCGWDKMIGSGAVPSTVEMACLEWLRTADAPEFKSVQRLLK